MHCFYCIALFIASGTILLAGFSRVYRSCQSVEAALITITALNTTFALAFICITVLLGALSLYWFSHGLEAGYFFAGLFLSLIACYLLHGKTTEKTGFLLCLLSNLLVVLFSVFFLSAFYDSSFDGRTYHQTAVYYLKNGWIPDKEQLSIRWCNEYPKAPWIWEALVYKLGSSIEGGKGINCLVVYALFNCALYSSLRLKRSIAISCMFATLAVANPVVITQFFSFYTDGLLYLFMVNIVLLVSLLLRAPPEDRGFIIGMLLFIIPFTANIKFTGMIYAYLMLGLACLFAAVKRHKDSLHALVRISILSLVLSVMLVGYNPYWSNVKGGMHLFHPLLGSSKIDIMTMNRPRYMNEHNPFYNFIASLLSRVSNNRNLQEPELRTPLQLPVVREIRSLYIDTRINGFGPYFVVSLVLSLLLIAYAACKKWPPGQEKIPFLYMAAAIVLATAVNKEAWWARYAPHLWLTTALVLMCPNFSKLFNITRIFIFILCLTTALPTIYYTAKNNRQASLTLRHGIEKIKSAKNNIVVFSQMNDFDTALKALLEDNGLAFVYAAPTDTLVPLFVYKKRFNQVVAVCQKIN